MGDEDPPVTGDLLSVELRDGFESFDFAIPFILREQEEALDHAPIDVSSLTPFSAMSRGKLVELVGKGDTFTSQDLQSSPLFGDYRLEGAVMEVSGSNDWLPPLHRRVGQKPEE